MSSGRQSSSAVRPRTARALSLVFLAGAAAHAGTAARSNAGVPVLDLTFESAADLPTVGSASIVAGGAGGIGSALRFNPSQSFEVFWDLKPGGAPFTRNDGAGIYHLSFDNFVPAGTPEWGYVNAITTYNDARKSVVNGTDNYRAMSVVRQRLLSGGVVDYSLWQQDNIFRRGLAAVQPAGEWRRIDYYIKLFDASTASTYATPGATEPANPVQAFGRALSADQTSSLGATAVDGALVVPPGGIYAQREARALQLFGFGGFHLFDNVRVSTVDAADIDVVLRDVADAANTTTRRSDFNNDNLLTAQDADVFVRVIVDTPFGDANLDRTVNFDDLLLLAANYNVPTGRGWATGDFNGDQAVNFDDLLLLAANYNTSTVSGGATGGWALASASIPEPASMIVVLGSVALAVRRRRPHA